MAEQPNAEDTMRWVRRGSVLAILVIGWIFILVTNNFHITAPVVFVCLGYLAGVFAIYTLYRTGSTAAMHTDEDDDELSWGRPLGAVGELEREKRSLLKAIKEAEFDHQMGKLSKADADAMIAVYRGRAIEVIKEIDIQNSAGGKAGSVREQILREARARIAIENQESSAKKKDKKDDKKDDKKKRADKLADAVAAAKPDANVEEPKVEEPKVEAKTYTKAEAEEKTKAEAKAEEKAAFSAFFAENAEAKAEAKAGEKVVKKADEKAETKADEKAEAKADEKAAATVEAKTDAKVEAKAEAKAEEKAEAKADEKAKAEEKSEEPKVEAGSQAGAAKEAAR